MSLSNAAFAQARVTEISADMTNHLSISTVEVLDVTDIHQTRRRSQTEQLSYQSETTSAALNFDQWIGNLNQAEVIVDKIINIGTKIWNVVEKGRPSMSYRQSKATALPQNITAWQQLEAWQNPKAKYYQITYKNLYGIEVAKLVYKIIYLYGGSFKGQGRYLGYVSVEPKELKTAYGYTFNVQAKVDSVYNKGTKENPIAGMILNVNWTIETVLKKETQSHSYHIDGLGGFSTL